MAKGTRYTPEFKAKAVRLLTESRGSYSSETKAIEQVAKDLGAAPETLRRWRNKTDATVAAETKQSAEERDIDDGVGFFRGTARPDTALMVAYIDEFKDRFRGGPIRRVLAASLDCGFITPRGYRMLKSRPVSRMAARHEAPARDILEIHADSFMAVYGYRKTHAQLLARGRDPAEIGRDQVMNVMRESGIRGVRRGRTPVEGCGRQARPRGTQVRGGGAEPAARGRHHLRAHGQRLVRPHGVRRRRVRPQDRRMGVRHHHGHQGAAAAGAGTGDVMGRLAWRHGRSRAPFRPWRAVHRPRVHHQGRGVRHASLGRHGRRLVRQRHGRERRRRVQDRARLATQALPGFEGPGIGDVPVGLVVELEASAPVLGLRDTGTDRNRVLCKPSGASRPTIRTEQKSGHII